MISILGNPAALKDTFPITIIDGYNTKFTFEFSGYRLLTFPLTPKRFEKGKAIYPEKKFDYCFVE